MLEKYESKQQRILRDPETIYTALADFNNFTPLVTGKVDEWAVSGDTCSFKVRGIPMGLRMAEKVPGKLIKLEATESSPVGFTFWLQLKEAAPYDTRMRLVLHAEMNTMIKMMIGGKLRDGIDQMAEQIAKTFNTV